MPYIGAFVVGFTVGCITLSRIVHWALGMRELVNRQDHQSKARDALLTTLFHSGPWLLVVAVVLGYHARSEPWASGLFAGAAAAIMLLALASFPGTRRVLPFHRIRVPRVLDPFRAEPSDKRTLLHIFGAVYSLLTLVTLYGEDVAFVIIFAISAYPAGMVLGMFFWFLFFEPAIGRRRAFQASKRVVPGERER